MCRILTLGLSHRYGKLIRYAWLRTYVENSVGLELVENSSGKHKGRSRISKRGRRKLRKILYQVMVPLLARNNEFRAIYDYYVTRVKNPLKRRQAMIAVSCKLIRVFMRYEQRERITTDSR